MVGSAGNAPVVASGLFEDTGFTGRQPDHLPESGSGGGSCAHRGRAYEARPNLILPAIRKWWSRWVARPHQPACKAGALLVCHDPRKMAGRLGAAPSELSFGDSVAQAGARPVDIRALRAANRRSSIINHKWNGAAAGNCARTFALARRHSAVKSQPQGK